MSQLIKCPRCLLDNREKVLGEVLGVGTVAIARQRSKWSYEDATIVIGNEFTLICGYCRTPVYIQRKEMNYESSNQREFRIYWIAFGQGTVRQELGNSQNTAGSVVQSNGLAHPVSN